METPDSIHAFWFGEGGDDAATLARQSALWWGKQEAADALIRQRFGPWVEAMADGRLDDWAATPRGRLALILLADQFTRNMYRDQGRAFACDPRARAWSREAIVSGLHLAYRPLERVFLYLPLEHAEDRADQAESVRLFAALAAEATPPTQSSFDSFLDFARRHQAIIDRFGRFPHRNRALGRNTTADEAAFLQQPGSSF